MTRSFFAYSLRLSAEDRIILTILSILSCYFL